MIAYTSGTTGRPKGAVATNANLIVAALANADRVGARRARRGAGDHRDGAPDGVEPARQRCVVVGCRLVMQPRFDAAGALALIEREKVTVAGGVPTVFRMMTPEFERRPEAASSLRLIVATGEVFPVPVKRRLWAALPHVGLYTFLAQTEAGYIAALRPEEQKARPHAAGRPIFGVEVRAVDADGQRRGRGRAGRAPGALGPARPRGGDARVFPRPRGDRRRVCRRVVPHRRFGLFRRRRVPVLRRPRQGHDRDRRAQRLFQGGRDRADRARGGGRRRGGRRAGRGVRRGGRRLRGAGAGRPCHRGRADRALPGAHRELQEAETRPRLRRAAAHRHRQGGQAGAEAPPRRGREGGEPRVCRPHPAGGRRPGAARLPVPRHRAGQLDDEGEAARRPHRRAGHPRPLGRAVGGVRDAVCRGADDRARRLDRCRRGRADRLHRGWPAPSSTASGRSRTRSGGISTRRSCSPIAGSAAGCCC